MTTSILRAAIDKAALWSRINSPWLVHFNSGSCNGCDIEILATLAPALRPRAVRREAPGIPASRRRADLHGPGDEARARAAPAHLRADAGAEVRRGGRLVQHYRRRVPRLLQHRGRHRRRDSRRRLRARLPAAAGGDHRRRRAAPGETEGTRGTAPGRLRRQEDRDEHPVCVQRDPGAGRPMGLGLQGCGRGSPGHGHDLRPASSRRRRAERLEVGVPVGHHGF